jgi:hypothetical protein
VDGDNQSGSHEATKPKEFRRPFLPPVFPIHSSSLAENASGLAEASIPSRVWQAAL